MSSREAFTDALLKQAIDQIEGISKEEKKALYQCLKVEHSPESLYTLIVSMVSVSLEDLMKLTKYNTGIINDSGTKHHI